MEPEAIVEKLQLSPPILKNGVLRFENEESLMFWLEKAKKMTPNEFVKWELSLGFRSFSTVFDKIIDEEIKASDSLTKAFNNLRIMPERIHSEFPIHSKYTLRYLPYLYVFPEGGLAPLASIFDNGLERLVNEKSEVLVGNQLIQYKDGNKLINGKILKSSIKKLNFLITPSATGYTERHMSTIGNYRTITDLTFTIRQSDIIFTQNLPPLPGSGTNTWPEWRIVLRNFRQGLFGWNTRNTTSLKIEGQFGHSWNTCPTSNTYLPPFYNGTISANSNGSNTSAIEWVYIDPNVRFNQCYDDPVSAQFRWNSYFDLVITGEGNNVSNFIRNYSYQPN